MGARAARGGGRPCHRGVGEASRRKPLTVASSSYASSARPAPDGARPRSSSRWERRGTYRLRPYGRTRRDGFAMFRVENADFIADKLAAELLPDQEYREAAKNSEEAIRRLLEAGHANGGRIEFDVDWAMRAAVGKWFISCADDGDGMDRSELELYMTTLAVHGAGRNQSLTGNQGM